MRLHLRTRAIDLAVVMTALVLCAWPLLPTAGAAGGSQVEVPIKVHQRVGGSAMISWPVAASFTLDRDGRSTGQVGWDTWVTDPKGFKLSVSSDSTPAMRDRAGSASISDLGARPGTWSVAGSDRRFGFSAKGERALGSYAGGTRWRGFQGTRAIEAARKQRGASGMTRTTIAISSEMKAALPSSARPTARVVATATANL